VNSDELLWVVARAAGLASFFALSISLLSGLALRTAVLDWVGSNRALRSLHEYTAVLWIPLGLIHLVAVLFDRTARLTPLDLVIPFRAPYGAWAIGMGTLALELFVLVAVTGWLKKRIRAGLWQWLHRLAYVGFGLLFVHATLAGSDFSDPVVSALTWSVAASLAVLSLARAVFGRLPA
jgi:predicted ferric reductase